MNFSGNDYLLGLPRLRTSAISTSLLAEMVPARGSQESRARGKSIPSHPAGGRVWPFSMLMVHRR